MKAFKLISLLAFTLIAACDQAAYFAEADEVTSNDYAGDYASDDYGESDGFYEEEAEEKPAKKVRQKAPNVCIVVHNYGNGEGTSDPEPNDAADIDTSEGGMMTIEEDLEHSVEPGLEGEEASNELALRSRRDRDKDGKGTSYAEETTMNCGNAEAHIDAHSETSWADGEGDSLSDYPAMDAGDYDGDYDFDDIDDFGGDDAGDADSVDDSDEESDEDEREER